MGRLSRRAFVGGAAGLGLLAGCGRLPGQGQSQPQSSGLYRIGFLASGNSDDGLRLKRFEAFHQGLRDRGYVEGQTFLFERRWAEGRLDRLPDLASELVAEVIPVLSRPPGQHK